MKGSCTEKSGLIGGLPFFNQQADGSEIPGLVSGTVQTRPAVEKSELCQVTENEVEPRIPPLCKMPALEALARGEACPGARVASKPGIAPRFLKRIVAVFFDELVQTFVISYYVSLNKQVV